MKQALFILLILSSFGLQAARDITISSIPTTIKGKTLALEIEQVLLVAYSKLDINVNFEHYPVGRTLLYSNSGKTDGELFGTHEIESVYTNLIRVNVPLSSRFMFLFVKQGNEFSVDGWESIPESYTLGHKRNVEFVESAVIKHKIGAYSTKDSENMFLQLDADRVQVVLSSVNGYKSVAKKHQLEDIVMLEPAVYTAHLYHYLNIKNAELVPQLERVLQEMRASGEIEAIQERVEAEFGLPDSK
ncbi:transporter substrate-binding domain-containing protein [Vibrio sp. JC009]|uniref:transporter substrate-binding domain-containing protein n=1 Tax=Vibrio sp. JC009 TaxID=2912314 RepID=UPI0023AED8F0|nr:transporter substrate-binding domain-containing protein [Vibrio sp. JC009]WED24097.1 transporter substrate-binding domain-containing protein [Vibrio sp. JC009]